MSALRDLGKLKHRTRSISNESPTTTEMHSQSSNSKGMAEDTSNDSDQNMSGEKPPTPDIQNTDNTKSINKSAILSVGAGLFTCT